MALAGGGFEPTDSREEQSVQGLTHATREAALAHLSQAIFPGGLGIVEHRDAILSGEHDASDELMLTGKGLSPVPG